MNISICKYVSLAWLGIKKKTLVRTQWCRSTDATITAFACLWELCVFACVHTWSCVHSQACMCVFVCVCCWSCLKESSSDGGWKPCSAAVLPVHRQLHCWALNTCSAWTAQSFPLSCYSLSPLAESSSSEFFPTFVFTGFCVRFFVAHFILVEFLPMRAQLRICRTGCSFFPKQNSKMEWWSLKVIDRSNTDGQTSCHDDCGAISTLWH